MHLYKVRHERERLFLYNSIKCKVHSFSNLVNILISAIYYQCLKLNLLICNLSKFWRAFHRWKGPMKGVFQTPDTSPFFPSDTDIQTSINVGQHRHSALLVRHSTLHSARHWTLSLSSRRRTLQKISSRHPTLRPPSWALWKQWSQTWKAPCGWRAEN